MIPSPKTARRRYAIAGVAAGALLLTACSPALTDGHPSVGSGVGAAAAGHGGVGLDAYLGSIAKKTAAQTSADVTVSMNMQVAGQSVDLTGSGQIDFAHKAMSLSLAMAVMGHSISMHELMTGGSIYMSVEMDGQSAMKQVAGTDWVRLPLGSSSASAFGNDPMQMLDQLQQKSGVTVTALGPSTIDGTTVQGYGVTVDSAAATAGARQRLSALGLTPAQQQQVLDVVSKAGPLHYSVYIDPAADVLRRMTFAMNMDLGGLTGQGSGGLGSASATMTMDFDHYGTPVHISAPPAGDVSDMPSLSQLLPSH